MIGNPDGRQADQRRKPHPASPDWVGRLPPLLLRRRHASSTRPRSSRTPTGIPTPSGTPTPASPVDVLRDLMDHRNLDATRGYYRVGEDRRRDAVDKVTAMQFDRHGNRIWREARALLDAEHARYAVGEVAVPYGSCSEPSNVAAGGGACPFRFRCAGCDHFRTDVSYLPDLTAYLDDLLRTRERLAAASRPRRLGPRRRHAVRGGDHPHPAAHQPDQGRHRRAAPPPNAPRSTRPSPSSASTARSASACPASASRHPGIRPERTA